MNVPIISGLIALRKVEKTIESKFLGRKVLLSILIPAGYRRHLLTKYPLVVFNDGQDFPALQLVENLRKHYKARTLKPRIIVGIHATHDRMREYGTSKVYDYKGRGDKQDEHRKFVTEELIPFLRKNYRIRQSRKYISIGGFSLGGLSAFDIAWHHELIFGNVGAFSPSFWWRATPFNPSKPDENRIAIERARNAVRAADLSYYFMAGDQEEQSDRNNNGVIDVIDDVLDMVQALKERGVPATRLKYDEIKGGQHNQATWGPAVIEWFKWLDNHSIKQ